MYAMSDGGSYERHPADDIESLDSDVFLLGCLKESIDRWNGSIPQTMTEMRGIFYKVIDAGLAEASSMGYETDQSRKMVEIIAELLNRFASVSDGRLYAFAYLLVINRCQYSEVHVAKILGVTKAAVSKIKCQIETGLRKNGWTQESRVGRSMEAREKFRAGRIGKRKDRTEWTGSNLFLQQLRATLPTLTAQL